MVLRELDWWTAASQQVVVRPSARPFLVAQAAQHSASLHRPSANTAQQTAKPGVFQFSPSPCQQIPPRGSRFSPMAIRLLPLPVIFPPLAAPVAAPRPPCLLCHSCAVTQLVPVLPRCRYRHDPQHHISHGISTPSKSGHMWPGHVAGVAGPGVAQI